MESFVHVILSIHCTHNGGSVWLDTLCIDSLLIIMASCKNYFDLHHKNFALMAADRIKKPRYYLKRYRTLKKRYGSEA